MMDPQQVGWFISWKFRKSTCKKLFDLFGLVHGQSQNKMDDLGLTPRLRKPPRLVGGSQTYLGNVSKPYPFRSHFIFQLVKKIRMFIHASPKDRCVHHEKQLNFPLKILLPAVIIPNCTYYPAIIIPKCYDSYNSLIYAKYL